MNRTKNLTLLLTVMAWLCSTISMAQITIDGITYNIENERIATVMRNWAGYSGNIVIPETVEYDGAVCKVTALAQDAFRDCPELTSVSIPNSVNTIGKAAFSGCSGLTDVYIPNSVTVIEAEAFFGCSSLTNINIPIGLVAIKEKSFKNCVNLTRITIPNSVVSIEDEAFAGCSNLVSVIIPNGVIEIGISAFQECKGLTDISIPNSVIKIGESAFLNCKSLESVYLPSSVTSIGDYAFSACIALTNITIPTGVISIGEWAFSLCYKLTSITIPSSVITIGEHAFQDCYALEAIAVNSDNPKYDSRERCNAIIETATNKLIAGCKNTVIPGSVTEIENYAFADCRTLTSITIPNSITIIGDNAFDNCLSLTSITIPNSVTEIGSYAFYDCRALTSVTIPNNLTTIRSSVFKNCRSLRNVVIGESVKTINARAFENCGNLTDVYCYATSVPSTVDDAFYGSYIEYVTLHVPEESIDSYKSTAPWSSFGRIKAIIDEDTSDIQTPVTPKCATPIITYSDGTLNITCDTEGAQFVTTITDSDIRTYYDSEIELTVTYNITTYATLDGYENSDTIRTYLCWVTTTPTMGQLGTDVSEIASTPVLVRSSGGNIFVSGAAEGTAIRVYSADGMSVGSAVSSAGETTVPTTLQKGKIAIVAIGNSRIKMVVR